MLGGIKDGGKEPERKGVQYPKVCFTHCSKEIQDFGSPDGENIKKCLEPKQVIRNAERGWTGGDVYEGK